MKKFIIFCSIFFTTTLFGYKYDNLLLKAQANIFPKLVLLDKKIAQKALNNEIVFCIVHHPSDTIKAKNIQESIEKRFGNRLEQYKLKVITRTFDNVRRYERVNAYYILQGPLDKVKKITDIAKEKQSPTFSYDPFYFKADVLLSMTIENSSIIYLNPKVLKKYKLDFVDIFYQLVRFYDDI
jgi:hypothetical protein